MDIEYIKNLIHLKLLNLYNKKYKMIYLIVQIKLIHKHLNLLQENLKLNQILIILILKILIMGKEVKNLKNLNRHNQGKNHLSKILNLILFKIIIKKIIIIIMI